jgi:hypothetical protein
MSNFTKYELPSVRIKSGESANIVTKTVSPKGLVCPVGLEIDPDVAPRLLVSDVKIGRYSQLYTAKCVPASLFACSPPVNLILEKIQPGRCLALNVSCVGSADVVFRGRLLAYSPTTLVPRKMCMVGLGYTEVRAGWRVDVVTQSQVEFELKRLHVPPHLLDVFRVDALFQGGYLDVEQSSQVVVTSQLGRDNLSMGGEVTLEPSATVGASCPVTVRITNTSVTTQYFSGALLGEPVPNSGDEESRSLPFYKTSIELL